MKLYAYCVNNPIYYIDSSGHIICSRDANNINKGRIKGKNCSKLGAYLKEQKRNGISDFVRIK